MHYAHTRKNQPQDNWHPLLTHLQGVAALAADFAAPFGGECCANLAGLVHDAGKFSPAFQQYLIDSQAGKTAAKGGDHAICGAALLRNEPLFHKTFQGVANLLAYVVAGHHAGLPDGGPLAGSNSSLRARLAALQRRTDAESWKGHVTLPDPTGASPLPPWLRQTPPELQGFALAFFTRMIFSCIVDADFLHTEGFCQPQLALQREGRPTLERLVMPFAHHRRALRERARRCAQTPSTLNLWREHVAAYCRAAANLEPGFFALTVPTGGGKTLASLAFALRHAERHSLRRIIYVAPFTSILEQNARVFRQIFGDDAVLEHHCNYTPSESSSTRSENETTQEATESIRYRLGTQNWDAPVIATTAVQFFESLFANRPSRCRKLHNMAQSVVIIDEAQSLPVHLLAPTLRALRELVRGYGVSIVLCTATQPALDAQTLPRLGFQAGDVREIIPLTEQKALFTAFRRTEVRFVGTRTEHEIATLMTSQTQSLCIVNTRDEARRLYDTLDCPACEKFHLSARMYPRHRRRVLQLVKARLRHGKPCRVVSTQLIEAGVDIDFPFVLRAMAGLDAIAQAAGRCNREGRLANPGQVLVFVPEHGLPKAPEWSRRAAIAQMIAETYPDVLHPDAQNAFFHELYNLEKDYLDTPNILHALHVDGRNGINADLMDYPFRRVAAAYSLINSPMVPVIIECRTAVPLVHALEHGEPTREIYRTLQAYTVQIYSWELAEFERRGVIRLVRGALHVLSGGTGYHPHTGLSAQAPCTRHPQDDIF